MWGPDYEVVESVAAINRCKLRGRTWTECAFCKKNPSSMYMFHDGRDDSEPISLYDMQNPLWHELVNRQYSVTVAPRTFSTYDVSATDTRRGGPTHCYSGMLCQALAEVLAAHLGR